VHKLLERWISIRNWINYEVSTLERVRSIKTANQWSKSIRRYRIILPRFHNGYLTVVLHSNDNQLVKRRCVHLLVLESFRCPRPEGMTGSHVDGNKSNNHLSNLKWESIRANTFRNSSPFSLNARKTHCKRGHPFNKKNTTYLIGNRRGCAICIKNRRAYAKSRA